VTKVFCDGPDIDLHRLKENTEFVWLQRNNILEHFLSLTFAMDTKVFNIHEGDTYKQPKTLKFKDHHIEAYDRVFEGQRKYYEKYKDLFDYELSYEDLFQSNPWGFVDDGTKTIKLNHYSDKLIEQARHIAKQLDWI
jgi:LPS sulfotransferase NodH